MTQAEAAVRARAVAQRRGLRLKLHSQTISDYERGRIEKIPADVLKVLAEVYGVTAAQLMGAEPIGLTRVGRSAHGHRDPLARFARPLEQFEREIIRLGAEDAEIDLVRDFFRSPEAVRLFEHIEATAASPEDVDAELYLLMEAARHWVRRRIERRVGAAGHGTVSGAPRKPKQKPVAPPAVVTKRSC